MPWKRIARLVALATAAWLATACASTTLQSVWTDPGYAGGSFRKIYVIGLASRDAAGQRIFEDIMVAKLQAAGAAAVPGWQRANSGGQADEAALAANVAASGADAVLIARLVGLDTRTSVTTMMVPGPSLGWYGYYSGWYAIPDIRQYEIATVETNLFDASTRRMVWSATSETINPTTVQKEAPGFADAIIASLRRGGFLPAGK